MASLARFQVKHESRGWDDEGPDLYRPRDNARQRIGGMLGTPGDQPHHDWRWRRQRPGGGFFAWSDKEGKPGILAAFAAWNAADGRVFQVGRDSDKDKGVEVHLAARSVVVKVPTLGCSDGAERIAGLLQRRFGFVNNCGGQICKVIVGTNSWSDHSWGDAVDECTGGGNQNDQALDWIARMGQERCVEFDYALGSRNGSVVKAVAPAFQVEPSSAETTHLTHVHVSFIDHGGVRPPWC